MAYTYPVLAYLFCRLQCAADKTEFVMSWSGRWTVCLLCLVPMLAPRCHSSPLQLTSAGAGDDTAKHRRAKRTTELDNETPWLTDDDNQVCASDAAVDSSQVCNARVATRELIRRHCVLLTLLQRVRYLREFYGCTSRLPIRTQS